MFNPTDGFPWLQTVTFSSSRCLVSAPMRKTPLPPPPQQAATVLPWALPTDQVSWLHFGADPELRAKNVVQRRRTEFMEAFQSEAIQAALLEAVLHFPEEDGGDWTGGDLLKKIYGWFGHERQWEELSSSSVERTSRLQRTTHLNRTREAPLSKLTETYDIPYETACEALSRLEGLGLLSVVGDKIRSTRFGETISAQLENNGIGIDFSRPFR